MNNEIIEKLQKIIALANDRGATQGEMEAAMGRAQELALKHGIELATLPAREQNRSKLALDIENNDGLKLSTRYEHPYHTWVLQTLEKCFGLKLILSRGRIGSHPYLHKIWLIGEKTDVAMAIALFPWLEGLFPKLYGKAVKEGRLAKNFGTANGFYYGLYQGILSNNKRQEDALTGTDKTNWALVVRSKTEQIAETVALAFPKLKEAKASHKKYNGSAIDHGVEKGSQIKLGQIHAKAAPGAIR
jgi:Protein of unknown function (DUF2786)